MNKSEKLGSAFSVAAVVVTYNRADLLLLCLSAIFSQSRRPDRIILINNASTDDTLELLEKEGWLDCPELELISLAENTGGAGGFHEGVRKAREDGYDFVWLMDDDVVPKVAALQELLDSLATINDKSIFLSSVAFSQDETQTVNVPLVNADPTEGGYPNWAYLLERGLVQISAATFVSILIPTEVIRKVGLPMKEFFIWGDDTEYTLRMSRGGVKGYYVGSSRVLHLRPGVQGLDIRNESESNRIRLYEFLYRNRMYLARRYGTESVPLFVYRSLVRAASCLLRQRSLLKARVIVVGVLKGCFFNPRLEM